MQLTLVVPAFKAEKWFKLNNLFWNEITKHAKVIVVEDDKPGVSKKSVESFGGKYFSKLNGNWGSVINFVKENHLIKTKYFAILDSDDIINIRELKILLDELLKNKDFYITNVIKKSFVNGNEKLVDKSNFSVDRTVPFIHSIWIKTKLLENLPKMPENTFYSDDLFVTFMQSINNLDWQFVKCSPYIHFIDMPGQSISQYKNPKENFALNFYQYLRFSEFIGNSKNKKIIKNSHETAIYNLCLLYSLTKKRDIKSKAKEAIGKHVKFLRIPKFAIRIYFIFSRIWFTKTRRKLGDY